MLSNCRPLRLGSALGVGADPATDFRQEARALGRLRTGAGNAAYLVVDGAPRTGLGWRRGSPSQIRALADGRYLVVARNMPHDAHSERRCIRLFRRNFAHDARVSFVFTEREPCSDGPDSCMRLLSLFLEQRGERGVHTPVRYLADYKNRGEVRTAASIDLGRKPDRDEERAVRKANRREGQAASRQTHHGRAVR